MCKFGTKTSKISLHMHECVNLLKITGIYTFTQTKFCVKFHFGKGKICNRLVAKLNFSPLYINNNMFNKPFCRIICINYTVVIKIWKVLQNYIYTPLYMHALTF